MHLPDVIRLFPNYFTHPSEPETKNRERNKSQTIQKKETKTRHTYKKKVSFFAAMANIH